MILLVYRRLYSFTVTNPRLGLVVDDGAWLQAFFHLKESDLLQSVTLPTVGKGHTLLNPTASKPKKYQRAGHRTDNSFMDRLGSFAGHWPFEGSGRSH